MVSRSTFEQEMGKNANLFAPALRDRSLSRLLNA
jgi:hypothetical protein